MITSSNDSTLHDHFVEITASMWTSQNCKAEKNKTQKCMSQTKESTTHTQNQPGSVAIVLTQTAGHSQNWNSHEFFISDTIQNRSCNSHDEGNQKK